MVCDYAKLWRLDSGITKCLYTNPPRPRRPLTDRDVFIVQDYVRVTNRNDGGTSDETWFYTYNHDVDHPYFAPRSGFVRAKVKYQGMVGVLGDGGKTRLTWLVNMDFGGAVPTSFMNAMIVNLMFYPVSIVERVMEHLRKNEGNVAAFTSSAALEDLTSAGAALEGKRESDAELKLRTELAEMKAEMVRKDDELRKQGEELRRKDRELRNKDEEHRSMLADKDKEIMELRRRLPRLAEGEV